MQERHLRALRLLPSIIRLQRLLLSRLNRSIDHAEATSVKIGTYIEGVDDGNNTSSLALHFLSSSVQLCGALQYKAYYSAHLFFSYQ